MTLRKLAGDTMIYGVGYVLGRVLNFLLLAVYLSWKFDGEQVQYGLHTEFYFYVAFLLILLTLRMETTYFRFASKRDNPIKAFNQTCLMLMTTATGWTILLVLFKEPIAAFLGYPAMSTHVLILGLVLTCDVLVAIPYAALRLENRPKRFAGLKLCGILANIAVVLFLLEILPLLSANDNSWLSGAYNSDDRLLYVFVANLVGSTLVLLAFAGRYRRLKLQWDRKLLRHMLVYAIPLVIVGLAGVVNQSGYIVLLKGILPGTLLENMSDGGVYAAAARIAVLMSLFITAFNYAAEPFFFNQADRSDARQTYADVARAFTGAASILFVLILMYLDVIGLILGTSYRSALPQVVPVLLLAFLFLGLYYNFSIWYKLSDKTRYGALISIGGSIMTILVSLLLIPKIGIAGSAWASLGCYAFMAVACYLLGRRHYPVPYQVTRMSVVIGAALIIYAVSVAFVILAKPEPAASWTVNTILAVVFVFWLLKYEREIVRAVFKPR